MRPHSSTPTRGPKWPSEDKKQLTSFCLTTQLRSYWPSGGSLHPSCRQKYTVTSQQHFIGNDLSVGDSDVKWQLYSQVLRHQHRKEVIFPSLYPKPHGQQPQCPLCPKPSFPLEVNWLCPLFRQTPSRPSSVGSPGSLTWDRRCKYSSEPYGTLLREVR